MSSDDIRARLLDAAGPVFADQGFRKATVREICKQADVNLASVNYYFGDKERLYIETVRCAHELCARQVPLPDWPPGTPVKTKLRDFIRTMITRMLGTQAAPWQTRLMLREVLNPTSACRELVEDYFRPHLDVLLGILDEILPEKTPQFRRHQICFSIVGQCLYYKVSQDVIKLLIDDQELASHYAPDQLAEHISYMTLSALGLEPPLAGPCIWIKAKPER